jgi:hypothetical protein
MTIRQILLAIGGGLTAAIGAGLNFNNSMEQVSAQLMAFTKDGAATAAILDMIKTRAASTPFAFEDMATAATALLPASKAAGVGLEELIAQAEILAASNPAEGLEGAAFALKEAAGGDFVRTLLCGPDRRWVGPDVDVVEEADELLRTLPFPILRP